MCTLGFKYPRRAILIATRITSQPDQTAYTLPASAQAGASVPSAAGRPHRAPSPVP